MRTSPPPHQCTQGSPGTGGYEKACEYFLQAYEAAITLTEPLLAEEAQVHYGIAKAHALMVPVCSHTEAADPVSIRRLVAWKENRSDVFSDPFQAVEQAPRTTLSEYPGPQKARVHIASSQIVVTPLP
ncbi:hypothetical protein NDU88_004207 [Pleurodeles waltl]|uniref:Uncharacterized protein n=1 Tax=Pleurodeles waltl TaxID=8319 RepID=A0AAV7WUN4_PLEWA|nr:hypothetical protein NDU88_004207 [Pleurodeles waltl]